MTDNLFGVYPQKKMISILNEMRKKALADFWRKSISAESATVRRQRFGGPATLADWDKRTEKWNARKKEEQLANDRYVRISKDLEHIENCNGDSRMSKIKPSHLTARKFSSKQRTRTPEFDEPRTRIPDCVAYMTNRFALISGLRYNGFERECRS